ncbi:unnamed protein product [Auanema sp. JU1783]|nr:unnamed protein product [Auanema sp. JU1783]
MLEIDLQDISISSSHSCEQQEEDDWSCTMNQLRIEDSDFNAIFRSIQEAIDANVYPELTPLGSSGTYFAKDISGTSVAVFKPKDEEPFAELNPKWPKFFQKMLCFCCFGRACLIANSGYLSEAGASYVDSMLQLEIVPKTRVVKLASPSFYYSRWYGRNIVKPKEGSLQLFVNGYERAETVFGRWDYNKELLSSEEEVRFTELFQRMCVLDYIIRNTDRHLDNLLIRHVPGKELEIAAIDNGLAFPVRHPESASRFRTFPFRWANLKWAQKDWDESLREHLLEVITPHFTHELCKVLQELFSNNSINNRVLIEKQLRIVRGQLWNLRKALINNDPPAVMSKLEPVTLIRRHGRKHQNSDDWLEWFRLKSVDYGDRSCC